MLRDHNGIFLSGESLFYDKCLDAITAEVLACRDGLNLALGRGVVEVHLETDCQELTRLWELEEEQRSHIMSLLREIKELRCNFAAFRFTFAS